MKVLVLSSLYPSDAMRRHGIFIEHRVAHTRQPGDQYEIVAPVPWFPFTSRRFGHYADYARIEREGVRRGLNVRYPRFPALPRIGMTLAPLLMALALIKPLMALRKQFDFDVIDSYYLYPDGVAAALLARLFDVPFLMTALGTDVSLIPDWPLQRDMILKAVAAAAATTTVAAALRNALLEMGAAPDKVEVVEQGVDLELFSPPVDRAALRAKLGLNGPTLLSVGHLIDRKGHDYAIRAIAALPGVTLLIAGDGPREAALRALVAKLGVGDRVRFLGHVDQHELPALYGAADVTASCSDREGIANVLLESLACGTPLLATPIWGSPEVVREPAAGLLVAARSDAAITAGLAQLLADLPGRAATRRFGEQYDWAATGARHHALLTQAVADYRPRRGSARAVLAGTT